MAINIQHAVGAGGVAAAGFGGGQGKVRSRAALAGAAASTRLEAQRNALLAQANQANLNQARGLERQRLAGDINTQAAEGAQERRRDDMEFARTSQQNFELEQLADAEARVMSDPTLTPAEKEEGRRQLRNKRDMLPQVLRPKPQSLKDKFEKNNYVDPKTGVVFPLKPDGSFGDPIHTPEAKLPTPGERVKLTEAALKYAKKVDENGVEGVDRAKFAEFMGFYNSGGQAQGQPVEPGAAQAQPGAVSPFADPGLAQPGASPIPAPPQAGGGGFSGGGGATAGGPQAEGVAGDTFGMSGLDAEIAGLTTPTEGSGAGVDPSLIGSIPDVDAQVAATREAAQAIQDHDPATFQGGPKSDPDEEKARRLNLKVENNLLKRDREEAGEKVLALRKRRAELLHAQGVAEARQKIQRSPKVQAARASRLQGAPPQPGAAALNRGLKRQAVEEVAKSPAQLALDAERAAQAGGAAPGSTQRRRTLPGGEGIGVTRGGRQISQREALQQVALERGRESFRDTASSPEGRASQAGIDALVRNERAAVRAEKKARGTAGLVDEGREAADAEASARARAEASTRAKAAKEKAAEEARHKLEQADTERRAKKKRKDELAANAKRAKVEVRERAAVARARAKVAAADASIRRAKSKGKAASDAARKARSKANAEFEKAREKLERLIDPTGSKGRKARGGR